MVMGRPVKVTPVKFRHVADALDELKACEDYDQHLSKETRTELRRLRALMLREAKAAGKRRASAPK